ncbi:DUF559 domain-containing protein [Nostoc linckia FACHB-104]|nr:DUF559 domain-containing protein [Nostoc linckia FACHB-104]
MPQPQTANNTALSTQQSAQMKTTKLLKVLRIMLPHENWTNQKLTSEVNVKGNGVYKFEHGTIAYLGQPDGPKTEYLWEMTVDRAWARALFEAYNQAQESEAVVKTKPEVYPKDWYGLRLRSPAEAAIAVALQKKGVLFFVNAGCRLVNHAKQYETREVDFLVFNQGKVRILEVDGITYHQNPSADYKRDRLFDREGIRTSRFSAQECFGNPNAVVEEFLELFKF